MRPESGDCGDARRTQPFLQPDAFRRAARIGIQHTREQHPIRFIQRRKGFTEARHTDSGDVRTDPEALRQRFHHRVGQLFGGNFVPAAGTVRGVCPIRLPQRTAVRRVQTKFAAGRADVQSPDGAFYRRAHDRSSIRS